MRIGMMVDLYKPYISGVTIYVEVNRRYLESQGHEVHVFTFSGDQDKVEDDPFVHRTPGIPIAEGFALNVAHTRENKKLIQSMDLIHVHHPLISGRLALRYCKPLAIPVIFTNHTRYDLMAQNYLPHVPKEISNTLLETYLPNFCASVDMVISPSQGMVDIMRGFKVTAPITVVPNGVETERFKTAVGRPKREARGFKDSDVLFIYAGRIAPEKNIPLVIKAFNGVAQAVGNVHLLIVGSGIIEDEIRELAAQSPAPEQIHFTGRIAYDELPSYLNMCDVFVTGSASEVHPLSVIEAMAAGLPVLGIDSPGVSDTIHDNETGMLCQEDDLAAFTAKLTRLSIDHTLRKKMSAAAREGSDEFSIERTGAMMVEHYQRLIKDSSPRHAGLRYNLRYLWEKWIA